MELWKYYRKIYRRKWLIIIGMILCVGLAAVVAWMQPPSFTAVARVMERSPSYAGMNVFTEAVYTPYDPEMRLTNLARIASSRTVGMRVLEVLAREGVTWDLDDLQGKIDVTPERDTQLLRVAVTDTDPEVAVKTANLVATEFSDYYRELIYGPTTQREYIEKQVEIARQKLSKARRDLEAYKRANALNNLDVDTQVRLARLSEMESELRTSQVLSNENARKLQAVQSELKDIPKTREEQRTTGDSQLWLTVQTDLTRREQELASMLTFRDINHPEVKALMDSIADLKNSLAKEQRQRIVQKVDSVNPLYQGTLDRYIQAKVEAIGSQARASALSQVVPQFKSEFAKYPENERVLADLTLEAKAAENTYGLLRTKLDEAKVRESEPYATGTIRMVDEAVRPERVAMNKKLKVALALPLSILLSMAVIFLLDYLDNTIRTPEEAEELLGLPVAAMVPIGRGHSLIRGKADAGLRESYQMISAGLWHSITQNGEPGAILVASAEPNSGRTITAGNLAAALAGDGARVILVDADLRQPAQHLVFGVDNSKGLSNVLAGSAKLEDVAVPTKVEGLLLVPSGPAPENPMRLLRGEALRQFVHETSSVADFVVFDTPAGAAFADATVMASIVKRVLLVQSAGRVPRGAESEFKARLEQVGAEFVGVVLNKVRPDESHGLYHFRTAYANLPRGGQPPAGAIPPTSPAIPG